LKYFRNFGFLIKIRSSRNFQEEYLRNFRSFQEFLDFFEILRSFRSFEKILPFLGENFSGVMRTFQELSVLLLIECVLTTTGCWS
jgi:hypothetical protein